MATDLTPGNDAYIADGGEVVNALQGNDQINIIHTNDSTFLDLDFDFLEPAEVHGNQGDDFIRSYNFGDRLYGDSGNDDLWGGGGRDQIFGGSGNDTIYTGNSQQYLVGDTLSTMLDGDVVWAGTGDDTVHLQEADNDDIVRGEGGYDTLYLHNSAGKISQFSLFVGGSNQGLHASGFEVLHYYGADIFETIEGGNQRDWIYGRGGTDLISGLGGNDRLSGDAGADLINGGDGDDNIVGGTEDDILRGDAGNDTIYGQTGNDAIRDGAGNDSVFGDSGNDRFHTGSGTDTVKGGIGNDVIREEGTDVRTITVKGVQTLVIGGDKLYGENGEDDIDGGNGADYIDGGNDDDILRGGTQNDTIFDRAGDDTIHGDAGDDKISTGKGEDFVYGGDGDDTIVQEGSDVVNVGGHIAIGGDSLNGNHGNDSISGGDGEDSLYGGSGDDVLNGGEHGDYIVGGTGIDTVSYAGASAGVTVWFTAFAPNAGDAVGDEFLTVENLVGSSFNDSLNADANVNTINGGAGNDELRSFEGNDTVRGGSGADTFIFNTALSATTNVDVVIDFSITDDTIRLNNLVFTTLADGALPANAFKDVSTGPIDADDRILYNPTNGALSYDADGNGSAFTFVRFALLTNLPALTAGDFVVV